MPETPDFAALIQLQNELLQLFDLGPTDQPLSLIERIRLEVAEIRRQVWNARGAADLAATLSAEPPCATFSESAHDLNECKHCGWTDDAHTQAAAIRSLDR